MLDLLTDPAKPFTHPILTYKHGIPDLTSKSFPHRKKKQKYQSAETTRHREWNNRCSRAEKNLIQLLILTPAYLGGE